jgi:hypothetical protein
MALAYPRQVIDVHTHVFNAHHIPIEGLILRGLNARETGGSFKDRLSRWLARRAKDLAVLLVEREALTGADQRAAIAEPFVAARLATNTSDTLISAIHSRVVGALSTPPDSSSPPGVEGEVTLALRTLERTLQGESLERVAFEIQLVFDSQELFLDDESTEPSPLDELFDLRGTPLDFSKSERGRQLLMATAIAGAHAVPSGAALISRAALAWFLKRIASRLAKWVLEDGMDFVAFLFRMLSSERENVASIANGYGPHQHVTRLVHMLMDMELAYPNVDRDPYYDVETQISRLSVLSQTSPIEIIGFAAFDPRRVRASDVLGYCQRLLRPGFRGFKFYPPMGYQPLGNPDPDIEASCLAFFSYCIAHDVPVFAHCTPHGFQAFEDAGLAGNPRYWRDLLSLDGYHELRLCLGHAGGGRYRLPDGTSHGWYAADSNAWDDQDNWARQVVELCLEFPNVYCEVGHLEAMIDGPSSDARAFEENFVRALTEPGSSPFASKCMYGSDAVMPGVVRHTRDFLESFHQLFERNSSKLGQGEFDAFVSGNAERYLGLTLHA